MPGQTGNCVASEMVDDVSLRILASSAKASNRKLKEPHTQALIQTATVIAQHLPTHLRSPCATARLRGRSTRLDGRSPFFFLSFFFFSMLFAPVLFLKLFDVAIQFVEMLPLLIELRLELPKTGQAGH